MFLAQGSPYQNVHIITTLHQIKCHNTVSKLQLIYLHADLILYVWHRKISQGTF